VRTDSSDGISLLLVDSNRYKFEIKNFNATAVEQNVPVRFPRIICPEVEGETNASSPTETSPNAPRVKTGFFDEEYVNGQSDSALSPQYATKVAASAVKAVLPLLESDPEVTRRPPRPYTPGSLHESPPDQALPVRFPRIICPFFLPLPPSCLVLPCLVLSCLVLSCLVLSCLFLSILVW
jgi:hypothetical protein